EPAAQTDRGLHHRALWLDACRTYDAEGGTKQPAKVTPYGHPRKSQTISWDPAAGGSEATVRKRAVGCRRPLFPIDLESQERAHARGGRLSLDSHEYVASVKERQNPIEAVVNGRATRAAEIAEGEVIRVTRQQRVSAGNAE